MRSAPMKKKIPGQWMKLYSLHLIQVIQSDRNCDSNNVVHSSNPFCDKDYQWKKKLATETIALK